MYTVRCEESRAGSSRGPHRVLPSLTLPTTRLASCLPVVLGRHVPRARRADPATMEHRAIGGRAYARATLTNCFLTGFESYAAATSLGGDGRAHTSHMYLAVLDIMPVEGLARSALPMEALPELHPQYPPSLDPARPTATRSLHACCRCLCRQALRLARSRSISRPLSPSPSLPLHGLRLVHALSLSLSLELLSPVTGEGSLSLSHSSPRPLAHPPARHRPTDHDRNRDRPRASEPGWRARPMPCGGVACRLPSWRGRPRQGRP